MILFLQYRVNNNKMDKKLQKIMVGLQRVELTEHHIYMRLAERSKDPNNAAVLRKIGMQEKGHSLYGRKRQGWK